jgi:leucyl aminopeptidase
MKITVERFDWTRQEPDLVVLVGDPYQNFAGSFEGELGEKLDKLAEGFVAGKLSREISFSLVHEASGRLIDYLYFHTSTEKGFTAVENLKTFLSRALRLASETGRKKVGMCLSGVDGEGLLEQLVEGALVGTFKFADFLKDRTDRFEEMELIFYPPAPAPTAVAESATAPEAPTPEMAADAPVAATEALAMTKEPVESEQESVSDMSEDSPEGTAGDSPAAEAEDAAAGQPDKVEEEGPPAEPDEATKVMSSAEPPAAEPPASQPTPATASWSDEEKASWQARDEAAVQVGGAFGRGVNLARALIAQPASVCTPTYLAKTAETMAKKYGFGYQSFGIKELEKQGFVGHIAVGAGSANSPKMFEMSYEPATPSTVHLVLVGKGVTFDTGGISIKTADKMHLMVGDMSGAAAVMGTMDILGQLRPNIKVSAVIVSAENSPDGKSFRPGDILRYKNGLSVHIENTDAEGRLLLADGLIRAGELGATHVIDIATLTGSCYRALGPSFTGVMGVNRKLVNAITRAGGNHGESYWRLPLPVEYRSMLKTIHADLNNIGGANAGATTAGLFLQEFVPPRTVWAHLDIAGTFWKSKAWKYYQEGPSGTGVKTLADLALRWNEHMT